MLQSFMTLVTGPFPARPHAALPFLQNFFPGAPQGIRIQCHKCKPYGDSPWRWKTRYVWKDLLWITHSRACGSWPQPHLVRRTLRKDLSGTILFFLYFYFSIFKQEGFETNDLVHLSQLYTSDFINVPCCHVPTLGTRMKHGGSWTLAEDGWWLKLLVKHFYIRHMFTISFHLCSPFLPFFKMFAPRSWRRRRK